MDYNFGLVPYPRILEFCEGYFSLTEDTMLIIPCEITTSKKWCLELQNMIQKEIGITISIGSEQVGVCNQILLNPEGITGCGEEAYELTISKREILLKGQLKGLFYGLKTLKQLIVRYKNKLPTIKIKDEPEFLGRGWMLDITRGKIPKLEYLKEIVDLASDFKINQLQLYMEHTFAFDFTSEINLGKDGLQAEDIMELDNYCKERVISLIPCISTFGHLYEILKSDSYRHLCEYDDYPNKPYSWMKRQLHHTLDCRNPESIILVKRILENFIPLFSSPIVNICGDETFDIGRGRNKEIAEQVGRTRLYVDFLKEIMAIVTGMGKKVMFFGDMIIAHPEYIKELPDDVICMNWNYEPDVEGDDTRTFAKAGVIQYVCPGTIGWNRALNDYEGAFKNITKLIRYGQQYGAYGVLTTDWGDFGHINCLSTSIPGLILGATMSWNSKDPSCSSLKNFHEAICRQIGFDGMDSLNPFPLLAEISKKMHITWEDLMKWYYFISYKETAYGESHDAIVEPESSYFRETIGELEVLIEKLEVMKAEAYSKLPHSRKKDLTEAVHMAKLVKLVQHLGLIIKEIYYKSSKTKTTNISKDTNVSKDTNASEDTKLSNTPMNLNPLLREEAKVLAVSLEKWQLQYEKLWRDRNRESELYRIREVVIGLCHFLREPEDF